jgi:coenzyme PQQ precursor peptide PqqA
MKVQRRLVTKRPLKEWTKPAYQDVRLGFEYTLYVLTR